MTVIAFPRRESRYEEFQTRTVPPWLTAQMLVDLATVRRRTDELDDNKITILHIDRYSRIVLTQVGLLDGDEKEMGITQSGRDFLEQFGL